MYLSEGDVAQTICSKVECMPGEVEERVGVRNCRQGCGAEVLGWSPSIHHQRKQSTTRMVLGEVISAAEGGEILVCMKKQDAEIYRNFLPLSSTLSFSLLHFFFWSLPHLVFPSVITCWQIFSKTVILNVCSSTSLTIFSLSFSVSSLLVKLISIMIILNIMKWCISHQNQLFIALLSGTSHFHTSCHFKMQKLKYLLFFIPLYHLLLLEGKDISYIFNLLLE